MKVPKPSDELDLTGNPCGVDEEALGSKFGRHAYCPDVVGGLPPSLRTDSGVVSRGSATVSIHVSQSHCLVIILKPFAVKLLLKTPTITVESTQHYKTCIRHHLNIRCRMIDSWPISSFKQSGNYTHNIAVISKVCILQVVCFSVPYYSHDIQLYFPIHSKLVWLVFTHGVQNIYCEVQSDFVYNCAEIPYLRVKTSFLTCLGYRWPSGIKVAEE